MSSEDFKRSYRLPKGTTQYRPREGVLESLGVTENELQDAVFSSFANDKGDCHASLRDLLVTLRGKTFRLEDLANVRSWRDGPKAA